MVEEILNKYAELIVNSYKDKLEESRASGDLINSVQYQITHNGDKYTVSLSLEDYWYWVENGRSAGKFPPIQNILKWVREKGIIPQPYQIPSGKYVIPTENQLAFLIGRSIAENGTEGKHSLEKTIEEIQDDLINELTQAVKNEIEIEINNIIKNG